MNTDNKKTARSNINRYQFKKSSPQSFKYLFFILINHMNEAVYSFHDNRNILESSILLDGDLNIKYNDANLKLKI